ncbi:beta strand repeat-containing protein [Bradyrhizobium sp. McL0616]|uniref:beta strand repeat-containing protein n=1 Tax=Bradyrhizobium sp. McL0616 TaxID=3415674 RepID=UPI003CE87F02
MRQQTANSNPIDEAIVLKAPFRSFFQRRADQALDDRTTDFDALASLEEIAGSPLNFLDGASPFGSTPAPPGAAPSFSATALSGEAGFASTPFSVETAPAVAIAEGASVEISGDSAQSVTFTGTTGTLKLDHSLAFTGHVAGLTGSDAIDLVDVNYGIQTQVTFLGNASGGTLTVTDGINTANIVLQGDYLSSTWHLSSDGNGGTIVVDPVAANNWQTLPIGAGGYLSGIDVAPDGTMVVRTDTYGAYLWTGTQWQQLVTSTSMPAAFVAANTDAGILKQGVYEIQIAPSNSSIMYMMYDGYVFKSINKGTSWTQTSFAQVSETPNDSYRGFGQKMAIDPNNPNVIYVGTPQNGLFVTTDGGVTWQNVGAMPVPLSDGQGGYPGITGIEFDPALGATGGKTNTIFAASSGNGVYESTNGGTTWTKLSGGPSNVSYAAVSSTGAYYAANDDGTTSSLWRYGNGSWTQLLSTYSGDIHSVAVNPSNASEIVVQGWDGSINISYNGGTTWSGFNQSRTLNATDIPWLANSGSWMTIGGTVFNPLIPNQLISSAGVGVWTTTLPTSNFSTSAPVVWNSQSIGINQLVAVEIIVPPGGKPVAASWDRPFFYVNSLTQYTSTYSPNTGGNLAQGWSLDYASSSPNFVVGLADWYGIEESGFSTDGGQTWTPFASFPAIDGAYVNGTLTGQQQVGGTIAASTPQNIVWAPSGGVAPYYTLNGGVTWNTITLPGVSSWSGFDWAYYLNERTVTADRVLTNTFYLYYPGQGVFETTNGGTTWTKVFSGEISGNSSFNSELMSVPGQAGNIFFTGGPQSGSQPNNEGFYRSTDGGATWTAVPNVLEVNTFGFGAPAPGQTYPSIYVVGWVNNVYGIWESDNNAQSWTQIGTYPQGSLDQITTISGDPNTYGQVYIGFSGSGFAYLPAATAGTSPTATSIVESPSSGDLNAGNTVTLTLNLSSAVTVAGGTPTLTLNDGGTATYTGGSGTTALTFSYTVGPGQSTASLAATAVNLNGATMQDSGGHTASLSLAGVSQTGPQIDTTAPVISSITETPSSGDLNAGKTVVYTLTMSEVVTVNTTGGTPTLTLNDGGIATYTGGSGSTALTFSYTVAAGQNTSDLTVTAVNLNSATVKDGAGNAANLAGAVANPSGTLQIDTTAPTVSSVAATGTGITSGSGNLAAGNVVTLTLNLSEAVTVAGGTPTLTLNDGGVATYTGGSGTGALTFSYTVAAGQNTSDLAVTAVNLNSATVKDGAGNAANLIGAVTNPSGTLQIDTTAPTVSSVAASGTGITSGSGSLNAGDVVTLTLNLSSVVTVAGGTPTLTLNDGGVATYTGGSGTGALTFSYTVAAGQNTSDLAVTAVNLNSATVKDGAGNAANLTGAVTNPSGTLQIDTTAPTVSSVAASPNNGVEFPGDNVILTLTFGEAVTVTGTPTLTLNDGGTAIYSGGSGTGTLTFKYVVASSDSTVSALAITQANLPNGAAIKDTAGNAANLAGALVTFPNLSIDPPAPGPTISSIAESPSTGNLNAGNTVTLTLTLSSAVTVAGGTPTLTLNDGGVATYTSGSGTGTLIFSYTVAAGQNTSSLSATAVNLNGATVVDGSGNDANLSLNGATQLGPQIDTTAPTVSSVAASGTGITSGSGNLNAGNLVTLTLNLSEAVTVAGGTPTLTLNDGGVATYTGGSGTGALTFSYTVAAGQNTSDLTVTAVNLNSATVKDSAGNAANLTGAVTNPSGTLQIDTTAPTVSSVAASGTGITSGSGNLATGSVVTLTLSLSEAVTVAGGTPTLTLNDGGVATYSGGSGTGALTFSYTVAAGQNTSDLAVTAVNLNSATVKDGAGNAANLTGAVTNPSGTLQIDTTAPTVSSVAASGTGITSGSGNLAAGNVVTLTLSLSEAVTVAGGTPTLTLNDGGVATYTGGSGSNALTFSYTVAAGQNTSDLTVTAVNLNSATVKDGAGNAANLTGVVTNPSGTLQIDTTAPTVSSVAASGTGITSGSGNLATGSVVTLTLSLSEAVTVAGGTPTLTLNDGGVASYTGGSGTGALTFSYTVAAGQNTSDLTVTAVNLNSATVKDSAGNAANLTGAVTNPSGTLQIDTTAPTVSSVAASGTGITSGSGSLNAGDVVTLTLNLSSVVTVAGGTPTLTLNDGGVATYTGGSGTGALTFSYTVAAGQNTSDLAVTAVNLNSATVKDGAGNAANLAGAVTNPSGTLQIDTTAPVVSTISETPSTGALNAGRIVAYTITMSEVVAVNTTGGTPTLSLNDGGTATYVGGSGTNALTFSYTVLAGQNTPDLMVSAFNLNGAGIADGAGNSANLSLTGIAQGSPSIDTMAPTVSSVAASGTGITSGSGTVGVGSVVTLTLNMSEAVTVASGTPRLMLNDGGVATYTGGSGTGALTFSYTVGSSDSTVSALAIIQMVANGATIRDTAGNSANLSGALTSLPNLAVGVPVGGTVIESYGSTSLVQVGSNYYLNSNSTGTGPMLKFGASAVTVGFFGSSWSPIGAEQVSGGGYDVAWKNSSTGMFSFWNVDSNGNYVSNLQQDATGGSTMVTSLETTFHQDLNGDGVIGTGPVTTSTIESAGSTSLVLAGSNYYLNSISTGTGPMLKFGALAVTVGFFGSSWSLIGAEQVSGGGYDVAWKNSSSGMFSFWNVDSNGNYVSNLQQDATGGSTMVTSLETTFHQDLNGDGVIGTGPVTTSTIESAGSTSLVLAGSNYYLNSISTGTGPMLKFGASAVTVGFFGSSWSLLGAEQVSSGGYDVAWKNSSSGMFSFWNVDSNGNYVSNLGPDATGSSATVMSLEATFHQDLNGDGVIGTGPVTTSTIESAGSTSLVLAGSNYYLNSISTGTGPMLKFGASAVTVGFFGSSWSLIGAEQVSGGGYDVAWKNSSSGMFSFWNVDSNGNYVSNLQQDATGGSTMVTSLETTFHQDLNGDGVIGTGPVTTSTIESAGSTSLVLAGSNYYLNSISTGTGPMLKFGASAVTVGFFGSSWSLLGAEQVSSGGYDVAWKNSSSGMFSFWNVDSNGNYVSNLQQDATGGSTMVTSLETTFHQDLNGDGVIGTGPVTTSTIESAGSTSLVLAGSNYYLNSISTGTGPMLKFGASAVTVGFFGSSWSLLGAEQVSGGGYDVAWKNSSSGMFSFWNVDSNGNYVSNLGPDATGRSATVMSLEATFHQDLNGDGVIALSGSGTIIGTKSLAIGNWASVELAGAYSGTIGFAGATGTLVIDQSTKFSGTLSGQLTTTDFIDLRDITAGASATVSYTGNNSPGTLSVSDGTNTATIALSGNYSLGNFIVSSDGKGGTMLVDPPFSTNQGSEALASSSDPASAWLDSIDAKLALWSQHNASAFPSSPFDAGLSGTTGISEIGGVNPAFQLATSATTQQHYQSALS